MKTHLCRSSDFSTPTAVYNYPPDRQLEPIHMTLDLFVDIENRFVEGSNEIEVISNSDTGQFLALNAVDFDHIKIEQSGLKFHYDEEIIKISFNEPIKKGEKRRIKIEYKVSNPAGGLYFFHPDEKYPDLPVYAASDHESTRARYWIPCMDYTSIRTTLEWRLTSKKEYTRLANGKLIEDRDNGDGTGTTIWKHDFPCPVYIATIAVGEFVEFKDRDANGGKGHIPVAYYTSTQFTPEMLEMSFKKTPDMVEWFYKRIEVPFAWDKYYQYTLLDISGAMENQSLVSWSDFAVLDNSCVDEYIDLVDAVNVHEMAHTYFGDMVVVSDFSHGWLKESWATFMEAIYIEDHKGKDSYFYEMFENATAYLNEADNRYVRPVVTNKYESSWEMFDSHLYPGGAFRLHMLRKLLGDDIFWSAVKDYVSTYSGKVVETIDFKRKLEEYSGRDLGQFFDQWIFHARGYPKLKVAYSFDDKTNEVTLVVTQDQLKKKGPQSVPFEFDLEIGLSFDESSNYQIHSINVNKKSQTYIISVKEEPKHVLIDPDNKVLHKLDFSPGYKQLKHQIMNSTILGRIHAGYELAKKGKKKNIDAIENAAKNESFWGVRVEFAKALAKSNSEYAIPVLLSIATSESHVVARMRIFSQLNALKDQKTNEFIQESLTKDLGPATKGILLNSLASQLQEDAVSTLKEFTTKSSHRELLSMNAYQALGKTRSTEACDYLLNQYEYGKAPFRTRRIIISSLASLHMWQEKPNQQRIKEVLVESLRDRDPFVRLSASAALQSIDARDAIPMLKQLMKTLVHQEAIAVDKRIASLRKSKPDKKFAEVETKLEELNKTIQDLEKRLQEMEASKKDQ